MRDSQVVEEGNVAPPTGLFILFDSGMRPRRSNVLRAIDQVPYVNVSHDPASSPAEPESRDKAALAVHEHWVELMVSGLTFDLLGLAPGPGIKIPDVAHKLACTHDLEEGSVEAIALVPGPHLADGANSLPVIRALLEIGCALARKVEGAHTICWSPARTAMDPSMFCRSVDGWLAGGPFPALGMAAFVANDDGAITTEGLNFLVGHELRFDADLSRNRIEATKIGVRVVHELVGRGPVSQPWEFQLEEDSRLLLNPGSTSHVIEVSRI